MFRIFRILLRGVGQVMFQGNAWSGAFLTQDYAAFNAGLFGYNGVLCAIALTGPSLRDAVWAAASVVLSTALQWAGMRLGLITLTAPFVLSTWAVLGVKYIWAKK